MRMTYDREVDAAYVHLEDTISAGAAVTTQVCDVKVIVGQIHLDIDRDGRLLAIEILDASRVLTETVLSQAERIDAPVGSRK